MVMTIDTSKLPQNMTSSRLNQMQSQLGSSMDRLSSGMRINQEADDSPGVVIASSLQIQIGSVNKSLANTNNAMGLVQTADGALDDVGNVLQRMRDLAVQSSNNAVPDEGRKELNAEYSQLAQEIDRVAKSTTYNGQALFQTNHTISVQTGVQSSGTNEISLSKISTQDLGLAGSTLDTADGAKNAIGALDKAVKSIDAQRSSLGASMNKLGATQQGLSQASVNLSGSTSRIQDSDWAQETAGLTRGQILQQQGLAMLSVANTDVSSAMMLLLHN